MINGLSVCIIGKDEERDLPRCLKSVKTIAKEIIYVDTGSKDKSIEICKNYNCKIYKKPFNNDFSSLRNFSIKNAKYKWILIIDCDEELDQNSLNEIDIIVKTGAFEGYYLSINNIVNNTLNDRFFALRLFKNRKGYKFKGRIHEEIKTSIIREAKEESITTSTINLFHYGYYESCEKELIKHKRNMEIYNSIKDEFKDSRYYYNLGNEYGRVKDFVSALKNYSLAKELEEKEGRINRGINERLAYCYFILGRYSLCINECEKDLEKDFSDKYLYYLKALSYLNQMKFTKAKEGFLELLELDSRDDNYEGLVVRDMDKISYTVSEIEKYGFKDCTSFLTTVIECNSEEIDLDTIKSVSEISSEIIVLGNKVNREYKDIISFKILDTHINNKELEKEINTKYILYLKNGEAISFEEELYLNKILLGKGFKYKGFLLMDKSKVIRLARKERLYTLGKNSTDYDKNLVIYRF